MGKERESGQNNENQFGNDPSSFDENEAINKFVQWKILATETEIAERRAESMARLEHNLFPSSPMDDKLDQFNALQHRLREEGQIT